MSVGWGEPAEVRIRPALQLVTSLTCHSITSSARARIDVQLFPEPHFAPSLATYRFAPDFFVHSGFCHSSQGGSGPKRAARKSIRLRTLAERFLPGGWSADNSLSIGW